MGATAQSSTGGSSLFVTEMNTTRSKLKKGDRGAVGSSMLSLSSNEDRESIARRTSNAGGAMNVKSRNNSTMRQGMSDRRHNDGNSLAAPVPRKDHRKY